MDTNCNYDSTSETLKHIKRVSELLSLASINLLQRGIKHDNSKLETPEKEEFDRLTPLLKGCSFGTNEYQNHLTQLKLALDHHYKNNSHHPQHYCNGVDGMDLFDLMEMFLDWKASSERHDDGDIYKSISINADRFKLSEQLVKILENTAKNLNF